MKLIPDVKAEWTAALRSGNYKQGQGRLYHHDGKTPRYCCLGVLQCLRGLHRNENDDEFINNVEAMQLGLGSGNQSRLASMNDHGDSFVRIADWIEANL